jgi:hypothetical protein
MTAEVCLSLGGRDDADGGRFLVSLACRVHEGCTLVGADVVPELQHHARSHPLTAGQSCCPFVVAFYVAAAVARFSVYGSLSSLFRVGGDSVFSSLAIQEALHHEYRRTEERIPPLMLVLVAAQAAHDPRI